jgi:hypothetical protein
MHAFADATSMRLFIGVQWRAPLILIIHVGCCRHCWRCWISASLTERCCCCVFSSFARGIISTQCVSLSGRSQPVDERCVIAQRHSSYGEERDDNMLHHSRCVFYLECISYIAERRTWRTQKCTPAAAHWLYCWEQSENISLHHMARKLEIWNAFSLESASDGVWRGNFECSQFYQSVSSRLYCYVIW